MASKVGPPFIDGCLRSLESEARTLAAEVIIVAVERVAGDRIARSFPWVRVVAATGTTKVPALRRIGVEAASGELVAIIEEHCAAGPDWVQRALEAHAKGRYGAVGGPIVDLAYERLRDWLVYFVEYHGALPPWPDGETTDLNDANICYRRELLLAHRELLDDGFWPMTLHPTLSAEGVRFRSAPAMVVHHRGPFGFFYYLRQRFLFSRSYAGVRARARSGAWRLAYLAGAPLVPFMMLARMTRTVVRKRCRVREFVLTSPLILAALVVLVAGEWIGCLLGPGDALSEVE